MGKKIAKGVQCLGPKGEERGEGWEGTLWVNKTDTRSGTRITYIKSFTTCDLGQFTITSVVSGIQCLLLCNEYLKK